MTSSRPVAPFLAALCALSLLAVVGDVHAGRAQTRSEFVPTFSTNPRVKQQVEKLNRLASQKMWDEWLAAYQQMVDDSRDLVLERDEEFHVGLRWHCHQLLGGLPANVRQRYRALYDNEARKVYDKAAAENDAAGMRDVYSRYRYSSHANRALLWLANESQDRGRHEWARMAYSRLARDPGVGVNTLLRYALSARSAGKVAEAKGVLDRIRKEFGGQQVQFAGQQVGAAQAADQMAASFRAEATQNAGRWTSFTGGSGDRNLSAGPTGKLKKLWEFTQPTGTEPPRYPINSAVVIGQLQGARARFNFLTFPVVSGDRVWVQGQRNVTALNIADGKAAWDQQNFVLTGDETTGQNADGRQSISSYRSYRPFQAAPSLEGNLLVTRLGMSGGPGGGSRWPADFAIGAFDARTGRQVWRRTAGGEPRGSFFNIPKVEGNVVFTGIATNKGGITEYNAVALDLATGETLWSTYLGAGSDPLGALDGSPAAVKDGVVWIESSLYSLNAVDALTGELRLIYHYDPGERTINGGFNSYPSLTNEAISAVAVAPRITVEKREVSPVVFAPRWGIYVVALDAETGRLLWSTPKAPGRSTTGSLFGVDAKRAYICGEHIQAINMADGAPDWTWETKATSSDLGFAALAGDRIYMPTEGRVQVLSAADGKELEVLEALGKDGDSPGYMGVMPLGKQLLLTTRDRVVAFGPE